MRFIIIGTGEIVENFLMNPKNNIFLNNKLVSIAGDKMLLKRFSGLYQNFKESKMIKIADKYKTEDLLIDLINKENVDFIFSIQYPWVLSSNLLQLLPGKIINLHNAKLPDYRGHNSISHEILNGETRHTTTIHKIAEEVDRGEILLEKEIDIKKHDTAYSLWKRSLASAEILISNFFLNKEKILLHTNGRCISKGGKYYSKYLLDTFKEIPKGSSFKKINKISRACWFPPHEPAYFKKQTKKLYVLPNSPIYSIKTNKF